MEIYAGTSGYSYPHWLNGVFYPEGWPKNKLLEYYCQKFNSVELNVTFYRLPNQKVFKNWYRRVPEKFRFALKGSRFITHIKRLKDINISIDIFFENASCLKEKLSCVLWQFPASFKYDLERLSEFISLLKKNKTAQGTRQALEFREKSWFSEPVFSLLEENNISLCIADSQKWPSPEKAVSDFIYLRFHGGKELYSSNYSQPKLEAWAEKIEPLLKDKKALFAFFNNDASGFAVNNALAFRKILGK